MHSYKVVHRKEFTMSNLVPFRSMFGSLNRWPNLWEDEDFPMLGSTLGNTIDLYETDTEVVVKANVAGVNSDDIDVTFEKGMLWIQAHKSEKEEDKKNKYFTKSSWDYSYKVSVPGTLDHSKEPEVELGGGILTVTFHKSAVSAPKKLQVKSK